MTKIFPLSPSRYSKFLSRKLKRIVAGGSQERMVSDIPQANSSSPLKSPVEDRPSTHVNLSGRETPEFGERVTLQDLLQALGSNDCWYLLEKERKHLRIITTEDSGDIFDTILDAAMSLKLSCFGVDGVSKIPALSIEHAKMIFEESRSIVLTLNATQNALDAMKVSLEIWDETEDGGIRGKHLNRWASKIWSSNPEIRDETSSGPRDFKSVLAGKAIFEPDFPIDYVFSWVNSDEPAWQEMFRKYKPLVNSDATSESRFVPGEDLKFALRSVDEFAPWVRKIFILTNCAPPEWLNLDSEKIVWVDHSEVFDESYLPTFNSHAIETVLHKIPDLSEHFIYSNDDFFLMKPVAKHEFFHANGVARTRLEPFGIVNGEPSKDLPDYMNGALNGVKLLARDFGVAPTQLHTHSPQSLRKSVLEEIEERYGAEIHATRENRFRELDDLAVPGFLASHYGFLIGKSVPQGSRTRLIQQNGDFKRILENIQHRMTTSGRSPYLSICLNDGKDSHLNDEWNETSETFLKTVFPEPSRFEK